MVVLVICTLLLGISLLAITTQIILDNGIRVVAGIARTVFSFYLCHQMFMGKSWARVLISFFSGIGAFGAAVLAFGVLQTNGIVPAALLGALGLMSASFALLLNFYAPVQRFFEAQAQAAR